MMPPNSENLSGIVSVDLRDFFSRLLFEAAEEKQASLSPVALNYTSQVLVDFSESHKFFLNSEARLPVLADILSEALEADFYRRVSMLRRLGDTSLMISGYFFEAVEKRIIDRSYYLQMGETAYSQLSHLTEDDNVFDELATEFVVLMNLVTHMAEKLKTKGLDISEIMGRYRDTKTDSLLHLLKQKGVYPFEPKK